MKPTIEDLADLFPCFRGAVGVRPWEPHQLAAWAEGGASHGQRVTIQLLLAVWNPDETWPCGRFDLMDALTVWDAQHRCAFTAWAENHWWP